ncbi:uncharacterized protein FFB20_14871 [Fusarium fujikuroi]|nr:uncharacterized protein FFB20_14871 [Fusarium fujikuroi]SCO20705.1 uncharacterized protein FFC1_13812 [Fusarium fujikuroi]SCO45510.1 uncharacterized protein FFNC_10332 [Fusarium fujikuroi]
MTVVQVDLEHPIPHLLYDFEHVHVVIGKRCSSNGSSVGVVTLSCIPGRDGQDVPKFTLYKGTLQVPTKATEWPWSEIVPKKYDPTVQTPLVYRDWLRPEPFVKREEDYGEAILPKAPEAQDNEVPATLGWTGIQGRKRTVLMMLRKVDSQRNWW